MKSTESWFMRNLHTILLLAAISLFASNAVVYGGLATIPKIGPLTKQSAQREAPLVALYMFLGERLNPAIGWEDYGRAWAEKAFSPGFARITAIPELAMEEISSNTYNITHRIVKFNHWAAPILLVVGMLRWWRRPKKVSLIRNG